MKACRRDMLHTLAMTAAVMALTLAGLAATGQFATWLTLDTPSYVAAAASAAPLAQIRLPVYGWLLAIPGAIALLPAVQIGTYFAATLCLVAALRRAACSHALALSVGIALTVSNELLLWGRAAVPELPGHTLLLVACALVVELAAGRAAAGRAAGWRIAAAALAVTGAWALRPSLLPFAVLLPVLLLCLPRRLPAGRAHRCAAALLALSLLPFLGLAGLRAVRVGDFNIVSFTGFQVAGVATLMLTPDLVAALPPDQQPLAADILARRMVLERAGDIIPVPANSTGQRSFVSAAAGYFDIFARSYDAATWDAAGGTRRPDETWPAFDHRLRGFALATFRAAPIQYAAWVVGATARLAGHAVALNLPFLLGAAGLLAALALRLPRGLPLPPPASEVDTRTLLALSAMQAVGAGLPVVLLTMPAQRYVESAALFLAAWPIHALIRLRSGAPTGRTPPP